MAERSFTTDLDECDRRAECPAVAHWWDCLAGRAKWRRDNYTSTVEGAMGHIASHPDSGYLPPPRVVEHVSQLDPADRPDPHDLT